MADVAVILGAGASWDVSSGSGNADRQWQPPLVSELFGQRARQHFWDVLSRSEGALNLYDQLFPLAVANSLPLESKLSEYADDKADPRVQASFKHLPPYISDVLFRCSQAYLQDMGNYRQLVHYLLADRASRVAFVVMNYDVLLETALMRFDLALTVRSMDDYVADGRQALVYKAHGSVDWARPIRSARLGGGWNTLVESSSLADLAKPPVEFITSRPQNVSDTVQLRNENWYWYPALTLPLANKTESDFVFPKEHEESMVKELSGCTQVLIVGTSAQDPDLLSVLSRSLPEQLERVDIVIGARGEDRVEVPGRLTRGVRQFGLAESNSVMHTFELNWSDYVREHLSNFAVPR